MYFIFNLHKDEHVFAYNNLFGWLSTITEEFILSIIF